MAADGCLLLQPHPLGNMEGFETGPKENTKRVKGDEVPFYSLQSYKKSLSCSFDQSSGPMVPRFTLINVA